MPSPRKRRGGAGSPSGSRSPSAGASRGQTAAETAAAEKKRSKLITRSFWGFLMFVYLLFVLWRGHGWVCLNVFLIQTEVFREMLNVRYSNRKKDVPWFRTLQWAWFAVAVVYFYGGPVLRAASLHSQLDWRYYDSQHKNVAFTIYSVVFVSTVYAMKKGHYRYQMNQLAWTMLTLVMVVAQMQAIILNTFAGLIWWVVPTMLVLINDTMAYFAGFSMGRKLVDHTKYPFLRLSPNKTWEGFVGGGIATVIAGYFLPLLFCEEQWFVCPPTSLSLLSAEPLRCEIGAEFLPQAYALPVPGPFKWLPGLLGLPDPSQVYSAEFLSRAYEEIGFSFLLYPEWSTAVTMRPVQLYCLFLAVFASIVAPFGGFFASAIKRAYDAKDFDTFIPGHGGLMDRFDCQFIMGLCTYTFYTTFCGKQNSYHPPCGGLDSPEALLAAAQQLTPDQQADVLRQLTALVGG